MVNQFLPSSTSKDMEMKTMEINTHTIVVLVIYVTTIIVKWQIKMNVKVYRTKWKYLGWIDTAYNLEIYKFSFKIVENLF